MGNRVGGRAYFPNLRYVALKLFEKEGMEFQYRVPMLQTRRKIVQLNNMWSSLADSISE